MPAALQVLRLQTVNYTLHFPGSRVLRFERSHNICIPESSPRKGPMIDFSVSIITCANFPNKFPHMFIYLYIPNIFTSIHVLLVLSLWRTLTHTERKKKKVILSNIIFPLEFWRGSSITYSLMCLPYKINIIFNTCLTHIIEFGKKYLWRKFITVMHTQRVLPKYPMF